MYAKIQGTFPRRGAPTVSTETSPAEKSPQASNGHNRVDEAYSARLQERFAIPAAFILRALEGEPRRRAVALCRWASRQDEPNGTLLVWTREHRMGRSRRRRAPGTPPPRHGWVSLRPSVDRPGPPPGRDTTVPREVAPERRDDPLRGVRDPDVVDALVERQRV